MAASFFLGSIDPQSLTLPDHGTMETLRSCRCSNLPSAGPKKPSRRTDNLRAVQLLLGHTKIESTVRDLRIEFHDARPLRNRWTSSRAEQARSTRSISAVHFLCNHAQKYIICSGSTENSQLIWKLESCRNFNRLGILQKEQRN